MSPRIEQYRAFKSDVADKLGLGKSPPTSGGWAGKRMSFNLGGKRPDPPSPLASDAASSSTATPSATGGTPVPQPLPSDASVSSASPNGNVAGMSGLSLSKPRDAPPAVAVAPPFGIDIQSVQTIPPLDAGPPTPDDRSAVPSPAPIILGDQVPLEMLRDYDTVFLIDDSDSMKGQRWEEAMTAVMGVVAYAIQHDPDGIDVYFFNDSKKGEGLCKPRDVDQLFHDITPSGPSPAGQRIRDILGGYMERLERALANSTVWEVPPLNLIVISDGVPSDDPESVLVEYARRLDKLDFPLSQVGVQMFQVGNDPAATTALQKLDNELTAKHGIRDMVDTVTYQGEMTAEFIVKTLLGGINRRLDLK